MTSITDPEALKAMIKDDPKLKASILEENAYQQKYNKIQFYEPAGEKHKSFHNLKIKVGAFFGGNRSGKTVTACAEDVFHLTGKYPDWWEGVRYDEPIEMWAVSDTNETTRDILQKQLLGDWSDFGSGWIPKADIVEEPKKKRGVQQAIEFVHVQHYDKDGKPDGVSILQFKAYEQGREKFQGTSKHHIHLDEEPPQDVFDECYMRTVDKAGVIRLSMTPLRGETDLYMTITEAEEGSPLYDSITVSLLDNKYVPEEEKEILKQKFAGADYLSRIEGVAAIKEGKIYPTLNYRVHVKKLPLEDHHLEIRGFDPGISTSACLWAKVYSNRDNEKCVHIRREHYKQDWEIGKHAEHIELLEQNERIDVELVDPAADKRESGTGHNIYKMLNRPKSSGGYGFHFIKANNDVDAGIMAVQELLRYSVDEEGTTAKQPRLTIDPSCVNTFREMNGYRYDKNGKPVKKNDHTCDVIRYIANYLAPAKHTRKRKKRFSRPLDFSKYG